MEASVTDPSANGARFKTQAYQLIAAHSPVLSVCKLGDRLLASARP